MLARLHARRHRLARRLQAAWRGFEARLWLAARHAAAANVQATIRMIVARRAFILLTRRVLIVQAAIRRDAAVKQLANARRAASEVAASARRHLARVTLRTMRSASIRIQAAARAAPCRALMLRKTAAAVHVQASYRRHALYLRYSSSVSACITLQSFARQLCARQKRRRMICAATSISATWRMRTASRHLALCLSAAAYLQATVRHLAVRRLLEAMNTTAITIQAVFRGMRSRERLCDLAFAATSIQAKWRSYHMVARLSLARNAATILQAATRRAGEMLALRRVLHATVCIQCASRKASARRILDVLRAEHDRERACACIQRIWRGRITRARLSLEHAAATTIEACVRRRSAIVTFAFTQIAVDQIQRCARGLKCRGERRKRVAALVTIQSASRSAAARRRFRVGLAVRRIQAAARGASVRVFVRCCGAARCIQSCVRRHRAVGNRRRMIAAAITMQRKHRSKAFARLMHVHVVCIQRAVRHFISSETVPYRQRVLHACFTMRGGTHVQIAPAISACVKLGIPLRQHARSRRFAMGMGLFETLLRVISSSNRSPHSMSLLSAALTLLRSLVSDGSCRAMIVSYLGFAEAMLKALVAQLNNKPFFELAADCLLAAERDPRLRDELKEHEQRVRTNDELLYKKRSLLARLDTSSDSTKDRNRKRAPVGGAGKRGAFADPQRRRLVMLLKP
jgi:hypothetical protein